MTDDVHTLSADSCLMMDGRSPEDRASKTGGPSVAGLSLAEAFDATTALDTIAMEKMDAVDGVDAASVTKLPTYRRYQARGVTAKTRNKSNIYGICIHTPEGYESGTLSVLSGLRAGFDDYLPLNGRYYPCNDISRYYTWHSGHSWGNPFTIGIEQGDFAANSGRFGDAHYQRLARLCAYYCEIYELRVEHVQGAKPGLMSHASLTPGARTDPGASFRWDHLLDLVSDYLRGGGPARPAPTKPTPKPPAPVPEDTLTRVVLTEAAAKGRQVFAGTEAGAKEAIETLGAFGLKGEKKAKT